MKLNNHNYSLELIWSLIYTFYTKGIRPMLNFSSNFLSNAMSSYIQVWSSLVKFVFVMSSIHKYVWSYFFNPHKARLAFKCWLYLRIPSLLLIFIVNTFFQFKLIILWNNSFKNFLRNKKWINVLSQQTNKKSRRVHWNTSLIRGKLEEEE